MGLIVQYVAALSYGKDSLAMLEVIHRLGLPLDRIITVEEWATDNLRAVLPEIVKFEESADAEIFKRYGKRVEHVRSSHTFESLFYASMSGKSKRAGQLRGWPYRRGCWANSFLKIEPFRKAIGKDDVQYIGIAADEPERIAHHRLRARVEMPLAQAGWTEADCREWCKENNLLSPVYTSFARGGCWFCCNQPVEYMRWLRREHTELWKLMLRWDKASPVRFKEHYTIQMLEDRFALEDSGALRGGRFIWNLVYSEGKP